MMHQFSVWAPLSKSVEVLAAGVKCTARPEGNGWWGATVASTGAEWDYGFILDGLGPFPDPRSGWQPSGVQGLSRVVDHSSFGWTDAGWQAPPFSSAIVYELHVGTFTPTGTFEAVIAKLDHLVELGVTHIELMPVGEFPGARGWGYDGVCLFAPHHAYGGPYGLKQLVNACHARRLAVLLDVVYNHVGPSGNSLDRFGPYFTQRHSTPWGPAINFDGQDSHHVRRFFFDNAIMWLRDYHMDGLRLDAVHAIADASALPFLEELSMVVEQLEAQSGRHLVLIAESDLNDPRLLLPRQSGGFGLHAQWNDDFHHALHAILTGEHAGYYADFGTLEDLSQALRHGFVYDGRYSVYRRRHHGRRASGLGGQTLLAYLQTHDQIGNRAKGERSSRTMSLGRLKTGATLVLTSPFVPMLFQGEEWGASTPFLYFTDHQERSLAEAVREGRRREFAVFGWEADEIPDPQSSETFDLSKLDWSEPTKSPHAEVLGYHQRLIRLRHAEPVLAAGRLEDVGTRYNEQDRWLVVERGPISVACNFGAHPQRIPLHPGKHGILLATEICPEEVRGGISLPPDSAAILKSRGPAT